MAVVEINEKLTEIDGRVRIESGPIAKTADATEALLADDATAGHYKVGQRDAVGKVIVLGEKMTYLDYFAEPGFYVYELVEVEGGPSRWTERSCHVTREAATAAANSLIA
jgi:hypothetical protein